MLNKSTLFLGKKSLLLRAELGNHTLSDIHRVVNWSDVICPTFKFWLLENVRHFNFEGWKMSDSFLEHYKVKQTASCLSFQPKFRAN